MRILAHAASAAMLVGTLLAVATTAATSAQARAAAAQTGSGSAAASSPATVAPAGANDAPAGANDAPAGGVSQTTRGRYLVHEVARCVECHSPRDRAGRLLEGRLLEGGPIPFKNPFDGPRWAFQAPYIRNLPGYTENEFLHLLMTGKRRDGGRAAAPMPQYRMERKDAQAIWDYLKTPGAGLDGLSEDNR